MIRRVLAALTVAAAVVVTANGCGSASPTKNDTPAPAGGYKAGDKGKGGGVTPPPPPPPPPP